MWPQCCGLHYSTERGGHCRYVGGPGGRCGNRCDQCTGETLVEKPTSVTEVEEKVRHVVTVVFNVVERQMVDLPDMAEVAAVVGKTLTEVVPAEHEWDFERATLERTWPDGGGQRFITEWDEGKD